MGSITNLFRSPQSRYTALVRPHINVLYRMAYRWTQSREEAEDLVQDVLVKLIDHLDEMQAVERLRPWLIKVLYHRYVDTYRRQSRSPVDSEHEWQADSQLLEEAAADDRDSYDQLEWRQALLRGLETLETAHRDVILLHDVEGYTALEIAEILDISTGTVKSRLHRGREKLKKFLQGKI